MKPVVTVSTTGVQLGGGTIAGSPTATPPPAMSFFQELQSRDWLERNTANFTHRTGTSQWEERVSKGTPLCYAFFKPARKPPLNLRLMQCRQQCQGVVNAMRLPQHRIRLQFGKTNHTDVYSYIELSPEPLSDQKGVKSFGHAMDVMIGITVHEMAHVLHTDQDERIRRIEAKKSEGEKRLYAWLHNVIEDERIERQVGKSYPGYLLFVSQMKYYIYDYKYQEMLAELAEAEKTGKVKKEAKPLNEIMNELIGLIRYPKSMKEEVVDRYEQLLRACQAALMPYPVTNAEAFAATDKLYDLVVQYYEEQAEIEEWELPPGMTMGEFMGELMKVLVGILAKHDATQDPNQEMTVNGQKLPPGQMKQLLKSINEQSDEDVADQEDMAQQLGLDEQAQTGHVAVKFENLSKKGDEHYYKQSLGRVANYAANFRAEMAKFNRRTAERVTGLDEGQLNDDDLVDAKLGSKNVFEQMKRTRNNGATIALLVDESGSMSGTSIERARDVAVLFQRALSGLLGIDFYCYGHTTGTDETGYGISGNDSSTVINVYFEGYKKGIPSCLGKMRADETNRDGHALLQVAGRMRKQTQQPIVLFMISDGQPSASAPAGFTPVSYTKYAATALKKSNIHVIHIGINDSVRSELMFDDYVKFKNMNTLAKDLGALLRKVVSKIQQPVETME